MYGKKDAACVRCKRTFLVTTTKTIDTKPFAGLKKGDRFRFVGEMTKYMKTGKRTFVKSKKSKVQAVFALAPSNLNVGVR